VAKLYVQPYPVAEVPVQSLTAADLDELYATLTERGLSPRTVRLAHTVVRRTLERAVATEVIARNPADKATPPSRKAAAKRSRLVVWTPDELRAVLAEVNQADGYHLAVALMATTGLRRSEALGLWWDSLDLEAGTLTVRRTVVAVDGVGVLQEGTKTDGSCRTVDLGESTVARLKAWRKEQVRQRLALGTGWRGSEPFVATTTVGTMLDPRKVAHRVHQLAKAAGVPAIRVHDLRHTHATHLLAAGVNPKVVAERLGHTDVGFTLNTYAHLLPTQQAEAAAAVERLVTG
jgi:integrase